MTFAIDANFEVTSISLDPSHKQIRVIDWIRVFWVSFHTRPHTPTDKVTKFDGTKSLVLSTTTWFGGKNPFFGIAFVTVDIHARHPIRTCTPSKHMTRAHARLPPPSSSSQVGVVCLVVCVLLEAKLLWLGPRKLGDREFLR